MERFFYEIIENINNLTAENYNSTVNAIKNVKENDIKKELYEIFI